MSPEVILLFILFAEFQYAILMEFKKMGHRLDGLCAQREEGQNDEDGEDDAIVTCDSVEMFERVDASLSRQ